MKITLVAALIGVVLVVAVVQSFQLANLQEKIIGSAVSFAGGQLDMSSWTADEKMNYEMHGAIPARASGGSRPQSVGMVGGC